MPIYAITQSIWPLYATLGELRLMTVCDPAAFRALCRKEKLAGHLKKSLPAQKMTRFFAPYRVRFRKIIKIMSFSKCKTH